MANNNILLGTNISDFINGLKANKTFVDGINRRMQI